MTVTTANSARDVESRDADENIFSDARSEPRRTNNDPRANRPQKRDRRDVHGWVILDKPVGMTSTHAVAVVKRLFSAKRAGHAGTLDPLASGGLPIALGEATKTVPFVMDGEKQYRFTVKWGEERATDDSEGDVTATSGERPGADAILAMRWAQIPVWVATFVLINAWMRDAKIDRFARWCAMALALCSSLFMLPAIEYRVESVGCLLVVLALAQGSMGGAALVVGWICVIHAIEAYLLNPNILGHSASMNPIIVVFALLAGKQVYGLVGALLAVGSWIWIGRSISRDDLRQGRHDRLAGGTRVVRAAA